MDSSDPTSTGAQHYPLSEDDGEHDQQSASAAKLAEEDDESVRARNPDEGEDDDDLDDLDDLLDDFSAAHIHENDGPSASGPGRPPGPAPASPGASDDEHRAAADEDFARQLQAGMADLLAGLDQSPEMQAQFESLVRELGEVAAGAADDPHALPPAPSPSPFPSPSRTTPAPSFQDTIRQTMQRMHDSGEQATAAVTAPAIEDPADDLLAEMLNGLPAGGSTANGASGSDEDLSQMLLGMMEQLTNKEVLYEPLKELHDKFPAWMVRHAATIAPDDRARFERQQALVAAIVARFERSDYADENAADREFIVERMQQLQAAGAPPADLVGDMGAAQDALADLDPDAACPQQ
ncbi:MAG: Peroxisome chaperone and import receptor [Phylliscum demangeonii]|nr:MAG: Peroxisome chaperone and import receptor [Phylliscum demangeonii]